MELSNDQIALLFVLGDVALMAFILWSHVTKHDKVVRVLAKWVLFILFVRTGYVVDILDTSNVSAAVMTLSCVSWVTMLFLLIGSMGGPLDQRQN